MEDIRKQFMKYKELISNDEIIKTMEKIKFDITNESLPKFLMKTDGTFITTEFMSPSGKKVYDKAQEVIVARMEELKHFAFSPRLMELQEDFEKHTPWMTNVSFDRIPPSFHIIESFTFPQH